MKQSELLLKHIHKLLNNKKRSKYLVLGPGARRTFRLSGRTPRIPFNVLSRTFNKFKNRENITFMFMHLSSL